MQSICYTIALTLSALLISVTPETATAQTAHRSYTDTYAETIPAPTHVFTRSGGPGSLDVSFGDDGITSFEADETNGIAVQPDGKVLTAGRQNGDAAVFRLLADGSLDPDFGMDGVATVDLGSTLEIFRRLAVQPDGKIIAVGSISLTPNGDGDGAVLARFNADGTLDTAFGTDGFVLEPGTPESDTPDAFWSVDLRPDGRIIAGGPRGLVFAGNEDNACYAAQYLADGTRDPDFGTDGLVSAAPGEDVHCFGGTVLPDGRYVLTAQAGTNPYRWGAVRLLEDGTPDPSFSDDGVALTDDVIGAVSVAPPAVGLDDSVTLSGFRAGPVVRLLRFAADGALDTGFGTNGIATFFSIGPANALYATIQPDGKYLLSGASLSQGGGVAALLARTMPDGTLDPSFGTSGEGYSTFEIDQGGLGWTVALDPEGRILVAGNDFIASPTLGFVARFENDLVVASEPGATPTRLRLATPAPNPATGRTTLTFTLAEATAVHLALYDVLGREVAVLTEGTKGARTHDVPLDASRLAPGLYVVRLTTANEVATRRLTVVR